MLQAWQPKRNDLTTWASPQSSQTSGNNILESIHRETFEDVQAGNGIFQVLDRETCEDMLAGCVVEATLDLTARRTWRPRLN